MVIKVLAWWFAASFLSTLQRFTSDMLSFWVSERKRKRMLMLIWAPRFNGIFKQSCITGINDTFNINDIKQNGWFLAHLRGDMSQQKKRGKKLSRGWIANISNISVGISDLWKPHANSGGSELPSCPALEYIRATLCMGIFNIPDFLLHLSVWVTPPPPHHPLSFYL